MTAGHVLRPTTEHRHELFRTPTVDRVETQDSFCVEAWLSADNLIGRPLDPQRLPGVAAGRAQPSHDWTLFDLPASMPNRAVHIPKGMKESKTVEAVYHDVLIAERPDFHDDTSDPVLILGATGGPCMGIFSNLPASIWMVSSNSFVTVYVLKMEDGCSKFRFSASSCLITHARRNITR